MKRIITLSACFILCIETIGTQKEKYPDGTLFHFIPKGTTYDIVLTDPYVVKIHNFLTDQEIEALKKLARNKFKRSQVSSGVTVGGRTSESAMLNDFTNPVVKRVAERAAKMAGYPLTYVEGLQVVRYKPGQEYGYHHDYFDTKLKKEMNAQRVITFFVYLNEPEEGGQTEFPELNLKITPKKKMAVFWRDVKSDTTEDEKTLHAGLPVIKGEKWGLNIWIRNKPTH